MNLNLRITNLFILLIASTSFSQINENEYLTSAERFEKAAEFYFDEKYEDAYNEYLKVNKNDTAYFDRG